MRLIGPCGIKILKIYMKSQQRLTCWPVATDSCLPLVHEARNQPCRTLFGDNNGIATQFSDCNNMGNWPMH